MKYFLLAFAFWSLPALAQEECPTVWVFNESNGVDTSQPAQNTSVVTSPWSDWAGGGQDQRRVCLSLLNDYNNTNKALGIHAELAQPTPVDEDSANHNTRQEYRYKCRFNAGTYPLKVAPKVSYKVGGTASGLPPNARTLTCENKTPEAQVDCLRDNIENVINPHAIDLRDCDIMAVMAQIKKLLQLRNRVSIANLQTTEQLKYFTDFLDKYEVGGGGSRVPLLK